MSPQPDSSVLTAMRRQGLRFAAFMLAAAVVPVLIWHATSERISGQRLAAERQALDAVLPGVAHDNDLIASRFVLDPAANDFLQPGLLGLSMPRNVYRASLQGRPTGVIVPAETTGFNDSIVLMIGVDAKGNISGVRVVEHNETRGLGDQIDENISPWILAFDNRSLANTDAVLWRVEKDGGDFDQFVGATITPRAVVSAIYDALLFFDLNKNALLTE